MDFISQYLLANSGTMVPKRYTRWAAIFLLSATAGRRVYVDHAHFQHRPIVFLCFVGDPDSKKTTAMDAAREMYQEVFPAIPVGPSVTTREDIVKQMSKEDFPYQTFIDETGAPQEARHYTFFVNELENFMSHNPRGMVQFLTDVYDRKFFDSSTIKHGLQPIVNPCLNLLACTVPDFTIEVLRNRVIGRGFTRRMLFIYETEIPDRITFPKKSQEAYDAEFWCKCHLQKINNIVGKFTWTQEAYDYFDNWNVGLPRVEGSVFQGYYSSKDVLAQKIAMSLALAKPEPKLEFTKDLLITAIAFLEANEDNLPKLAIATGKNDLALPTHKLLEILTNNKGMMPEKVFHKLAGQDMEEGQYRAVMNFLKSTDQVHENSLDFEGFRENMVLTHELYCKKVKEGEIK